MLIVAHNIKPYYHVLLICEMVSHRLQHIGKAILPCMGNKHLRLPTVLLRLLLGSEELTIRALKHCCFWLDEIFTDISSRKERRNRILLSPADEE